MATMSHDHPGERPRVVPPGVREMWASFAITMMWIAVVIVAVFAWLGTTSVARQALLGPRGD